MAGLDNRPRYSLPSGCWSKIRSQSVLYSWLDMTSVMGW
jgi:hypothetical protein